MEFENPQPVDQDEFERILQSGNGDLIAPALVGASLHERDWHWVQECALRLLDSSDLDVRRSAVIVFGHLARIHGSLDLERVLPALANKVSDPQLGGTIEDALEDIRAFIVVQ